MIGECDGQSEAKSNISTCNLTCTRPQTRGGLEIETFADANRYLTRERSACVSSNWRCQRRVVSLFCLIRPSTRYSMPGRSSVFHGLYGDIGITDCPSSQSCHLSISNSESPKSQRRVSTVSTSRVTHIAVSLDAYIYWVNSVAIGIFGAVKKIANPKP